MEAKILYRLLERPLSERDAVTINGALAEAREAGYEEGMKSQKTPRTDLECGLADEEFRREFHIARKETDMEMYKAGRKEVVEWVEENKIVRRPFGDINNDAPEIMVIAPESKWQAKLKEWGITSV